MSEYKQFYKFLFFVFLIPVTVGIGFFALIVFLITAIVQNEEVSKLEGIEKRLEILEARFPRRFFYQMKFWKIQVERISVDFVT